MFVAFILLLAFDTLHRVVSLAAGPFPLQNDAIGYWGLARQMASGDWFLCNPPSAFRTPLYPAYLAIHQSLFGSWALEAAVVGQHVMGVATSLLTAWMCGKVTRSTYAFLLGYAFSLCCLGRMQFDNMVLSESLFTFTLAVHFAAIVLWCIQPSRWYAALIGLTLAANILVKPTFQAFLFVELLLLLIPSSGGVQLPFRTRMGHAMLVIIAACALLLPWVARNQALYGKPFLSRGLGIRLWACCFSDAGAALPLPLMYPDEPLVSLDSINWRHEWSVNAALAGTGLDEIERDQWMIAVSLRAVGQHPWHFANRALGNWFKHWYVIEEGIPWYVRYDRDKTDNYSGQHVWRNEVITKPFNRSMQFIYRYSAVFSGITSSIALVGACVLACGRAYRRLGLLFLFALLYVATVTAAVIIPLYHFRMVCEPVMIVAGTAAVAELVGALRACRSVSRTQRCAV